MKINKLLLASASPRRAQLLAQLTSDFSCYAPEVDETPLVNEEVKDYVLRMAQSKAIAGYHWSLTQSTPASLVLGSDTCGWFEGQILGKPENAVQAKQMLQSLSGKWHEIHTAIALFDGHELRSKIVSSRVLFAELCEQLINSYVASKEPLDKAGSYGIQGKGAALVQRLEGSYSAVVGLPLSELRQMLIEQGFDIWQEAL